MLPGSACCPHANENISEKRASTATLGYIRSGTAVQIQLHLQLQVQIEAQTWLQIQVTFVVAVCRLPWPASAA